jgi:ABC-2 type transport system ATP-binding protein
MDHLITFTEKYLHNPPGSYKGQCYNCLMIVLTDLQKVQNQITVLDIPSLQINEGQIAALFGPVGCGIDVLFQLLIGKLRPTHGSLMIAGLNPFCDRREFSQQVGVLFSEDTHYKRLSASGNLQFYCRLYRFPKSRSLEVLDQVGLADQAETVTDKLSPGLSRRLALGRAILNRPQVLLLMQPFAGCDQVSIDLVSQVVRKQAQNGVAVLILAYDLSGLEKLYDTIYRLEQGRVIETFHPHQEEIQDRPFMIPVRGQDKIILIDPADILYVFAQEDHTYLQTLDERWPTQFTLVELEKRLSRSGFFRAHRAYLVNLQQVKEVIPYTRDSFSLRLKDAAGTQIPLSKSAERELRELLEY